ncbi:ETX/MTX2 family pore-forming toxin [Peribacillus simplex]|uniref:ETX/MTX2 family pore-forming toxin n=1 Tax=Peribacillus simplex TaxID=1478 RepID=A0AAW7I962_9BACI|nr:ETX/MTX2 family pore-forming toxin [Peribacillus simplex]MDM5451004.1 ETX/MTX2 family pore-forming toxin [Peribacillus simplex]
MPVQEKFSFSELSAVGSNPNSVREKFKTRFGTMPDGISVNSETYYNGVQPAITEQYGHPCYKTLGDFTYQIGNGNPPSEAILGSNYAVNHGDEEASISLSVLGSWTETKTWSSETTTGLTISSKFTLEGVFESGAEFSVSTTVGESSSTSISRSASSTVTVTVPPRSKKKVSMVGTMKQEVMGFQAPLSVQGSFGANFPSKVEDHYFWFLGAESVLDSTTGTLVGKIKNTAVFDVQTEVGAAEPITESTVV